jgi:tetratricopeptide (TPR) repeat protein
MNVAAALSGLGEAAIRLGQYERATRLLEESLGLRRALGDQWGIDTALGSLGWVALRQGDYTRTRALLGESLAVRKEAGDRGGTAWCLEKLAEAALLQAQAISDTEAARAGCRRAAHTFAAAAALRAPIGSVIDPADQPDYERLLSALRAALGQADFAAAWSEGQAMPLDQAVSEALAAPEA